MVDDTPVEQPAAAAVHRSRGSTASERLLADLGDAAFLAVWSYPNLFFEKKQNGKGDGKVYAPCRWSAGTTSSSSATST